METKKFNYEAPEAQVFDVETQNCFASGFDSPSGTGHGFDEEIEG